MTYQRSIVPFLKRHSMSLLFSYTPLHVYEVVSLKKVQQHMMYLFLIQRYWVYDMQYIGFEALHGEVSIYLVCGNTMCVSTCQVEFFLIESCIILIQREWVYDDPISWSKKVSVSCTLSWFKDSGCTVYLILIQRKKVYVPVRGFPFAPM